MAGVIFFLRILLSAPAPHFLNRVVGTSTSAEAAAAAPLASAILEVECDEMCLKDIAHENERTSVGIRSIPTEMLSDMLTNLR